MTHTQTFLLEAARICSEIDTDKIEAIAAELNRLRARGGRLFILGVGGGAANSSHAVNDFRKLCGIEAYAPTDNISELTARTNDEGWETVFEGWLQTSRINPKDGVMVFSVGGGHADTKVSMNLVHALKWAKGQEASIMGIVGRDGGYTAQVSDLVLIVPTIHSERVTPHTEAFQAVVWHCLVSHPLLQVKQTKW